jgi:DNA helicase-2/ATP-dependent DNA helicase PcrA
LNKKLTEEISELEEKQNNSQKKTTKTFYERSVKIEIKRERLNFLSEINKFSYNPTGDNSERNSLNHSEVIQISADFIREFQLMQHILVGKYPILLIDECQDTNKKLIEAFFDLQNNKKDFFCLGLFGDTMQRIYSDGLIGIENKIPDSWDKPRKIINYRCPRRVIDLINKIRENVDSQKQEYGKPQVGFVKLFIVDSKLKINKNEIEKNITNKMAEFTGDDKWNETVKTLTLEHHMAAKRGEFYDFFYHLYNENKLKTGLLDGTLPVVSFFINQVIPLIKGKELEDDFYITNILKEYSPFFDKGNLIENPISKIKECKERLSNFFSL